MLPFVWIKSIGIKSTARKKERSGRPWKEKDNCWREAQGMGSEKEWTGKEKKGHTHILICSLHPVTPTRFSFSLGFFLFWPSFCPLSAPPQPLPTRDVCQIFCPLLSALSLFPHVASIWMWLQVVMKSTISRPDLLEPWIFISSVGRHLWACKSKTTHFYPFSSDRTIVLTPWFLILV